MADKNIKIVLVTVPNETIALAIAHRLVEKQLAACVNILSGVRSVYRWQGAIESSMELMLMIKATSDYFPLIETEISTLHPYSVPEIIALDVSQGSEKYCAWVQENCK